MSEFDNKVAIIVGGARGVGRAAAEAFGDLGGQVLLVDLGCEPDGAGHDPDVVAEAAEQLTHRGVRAMALALDSAKAESAEAMVEAALTHFGRIDYGVYSAGYHHERPFLRESAEDLERVLAVHLLGAVSFSRALCRRWLASKSAGSVVLASSASAFLGGANQSALAMAAGGLTGFVKTVAAELRRQPIRVNALVPTARTRLTENLPLFASIREDSLSAAHVAQVICHLWSDASCDVRGEVLGVAGGRIYAYRHLETSGAFHEGAPPALADIAASWREVTRR